MNMMESKELLKCESDGGHQNALRGSGVQDDDTSPLVVFHLEFGSVFLLPWSASHRLKHTLKSSIWNNRIILQSHVKQLHLQLIQWNF